MNVDHCPIPTVSAVSPVSSVEQVQEHIGSELIHGSGIVGGSGGSGQGVDPSHHRLGGSGGELHPVQVGGPIIVGFRGHPSSLDTLLVTFPGGVGVDGDGQPADPGW